MQKIDDIDTQKIMGIYPILTSEGLYESGHPYALKFISVFDHWLTEDEAKNYFIEDLESGYFEKLYNFYLRLFDNYACCQVIEGEDSNAILFNFDSKNEFIEAVKNSISGTEFVRLLIPDLKIMIDGGFDFTLPIFYDEITDLDTFMNFIKESELFLLS